MVSCVRLQFEVLMIGLNKKFLLNAKDLTEHFAEIQNKAKSIRIAVAWATQGKAVDMLCNAKCPVGKENGDSNCLEDQAW
jgi:hypothetical protein